VSRLLNQSEGAATVGAAIDAGFMPGALRKAIEVFWRSATSRRSTPHRLESRSSSPIPGTNG